MYKNVLPKTLFCYIILLACLVLTCACAQKTDSPDAAGFTLTVLHTNDTHSNYGGVTGEGFSCYAAMCEDGRGGYVRLDQAVRAIRQHNPEALFFDAGDIFQGTLFWTQYKENMPASLVDRLGYQAIIAGNHEFDDGWPAWLRMAETIKTPVLAANISFDSHLPAMDKIKPYMVLERNGRRIGIIGVTTESTPETSSPGAGVHFSDAQAALEQAVSELKAQGVNIIIALAHLGLENEKILARSMDGVDIIVGAHSHSLLSNNHERAEGPYPIVETTPCGEPILVVTASTGCIYLGRLEVEFDDMGVIQTWRGDPVTLDNATLQALNAPAPDAELIALIDGFATPLLEMFNKSIGSINNPQRNGLPLEEPNVMQCRQGECLSGNVVADAFRLVPFKDAQIAMVNGGALRVSLPGGAVTPADVLATMPFQNTPMITDMPGTVIMQALERSVSTYGEGDGCFLQVSGLRYAFKPGNAPGSRVSKVEVMAADGNWQPLDVNATYKVVSLDFLTRGGDGFTMFSTLKWQEGEHLANDVLRIYLEQYSPVEAQLQERITVQR